MRLVQTAFLGSERIQTLVDLPPQPPLQQRPDGKLVIAYRRPRPRDWVDGRFVGDHPCDDKHRHGEP